VTVSTYARAEALRQRYGATRRWSSADAAPYFTYTSAGVSHVVWYDDADAVKARMTFVSKYGLRGLAMWYVGDEDRRMWPALRSPAPEGRPMNLRSSAGLQR
jgi:spore germination protein YaaH